MSDANDHCRTRIRTTAGHQIILDDTNERIYVSTSRGKTWVEIDEDGHINIYAKDKISIRAENDINMYTEKTFNLYAEEDINIRAKRNVKIGADEGTMDIRSKQTMTIKSVAAKLNVFASTGISLKTQGTWKVTAAGSYSVKAASTNFNCSWIGLRAGTVALQGAISLHGGVRSGPIIAESYAIGRRGPPAQDAISAEEVPTVVIPDITVKPAHEPWVREGVAAGHTRNKFWKPK